MWEAFEDNFKKKIKIHEKHPSNQLQFLILNLQILFASMIANNLYDRISVNRMNILAFIDWCNQRESQWIGNQKIKPTLKFDKNDKRNCCPVNFITLHMIKSSSFFLLWSLKGHRYYILKTLKTKITIKVCILHASQVWHTKGN